MRDCEKSRRKNEENILHEKAGENGCKTTESFVHSPQSSISLETLVALSAV